MKLPKSINILGTKVKIVQMTLEESNDKGADGYYDHSAKIIGILPAKEYNTDDVKSVKDIDSYIMHILRHEVIHALFHLGGLSLQYGSDELLTDFLAEMIPKLDILHE